MLFAPCHPPHSWCVLVYSSAARGFFGLFARRAVLHFPLGSPCFPPAPPFSTFTRESFCSRFPRLSRSPRRVDFAAFAFGVLCFLRQRCLPLQKVRQKRATEKYRAEWSAVIDIVMFHHCPFAAVAMPLIFSFGKCKLFSSGKTHRSFVRFAFPRFSFALSPLFF